MGKEKEIHLTGRPPILIVEDEWKIVAKADWSKNNDGGKASERAYVRVRQHGDGRWVVYGLREEGTKRVMPGFLVDFEDAEVEDVTEAISKTCAVVGLDPQPIFDQMPPEEV